MALTATLEFANKESATYAPPISVVDCSFQFSRPYNEFRPKGEARCSHVELTVVAPGKDDLTLIEWFARQEQKNGRLKLGWPVFSSEASASEQTLSFESARCFRLVEEYDISAPRRRLLKLSVIAESMNIDEVSF